MDLTVEGKLTDLEKLASVGELVGGIAHELNNPLTAILGYAELLRAIDIPADAKRYAENIHISALRSAKIIESLLVFLRKREFQKTDVDINEVIRQTVPLFEYQLKTRMVSLDLALGAGTFHIQGDFFKLQQVFFNLGINALQAMEHWQGERRLRFSTTRTGEVIRAVVSDSGPGIRANDLVKVFQAFFTTKNKGTGLGLSIAQRIVEEHHGTIRVGSNGDPGCAFIIELPMIISRGEEASSGEAVETSFCKKVLVVDDDAVVVGVYQGMLEQLGCSVTIKTHPVDGLLELMHNEFDIIFVDYRMPTINGLQFIERALPYVDIRKFVIVTGDIEVDEQIVAEKYGLPVIRKPFRMDEVRKYLQCFPC